MKEQPVNGGIWLELPTGDGQISIVSLSAVTSVSPVMRSNGHVMYCVGSSVRGQCIEVQTSMKPDEVRDLMRRALNCEAS